MSWQQGFILNYIIWSVDQLFFSSLTTSSVTCRDKETQIYQTDKEQQIYRTDSEPHIYQTDRETQIYQTETEKQIYETDHHNLTWEQQVNFPMKNVQLSIA